jgi:addiction module RelE/StbE family toxin
MRVQYDPDIFEKLKAVNVRIRKSFADRIELFRKNPNDPHLNNHALTGEFAGYRSIDITNDYRAIYEEVPTGDDDTLAYFFLLGTHKELYGRDE